MPDPGYQPAAPIRPGAAPQFDGTQTVFATDPKAAQPIYLKMTDVLIQVLRYHFGNVNYIEYPNLTGRVFLPNDREASPIQISSLAEWNPKNTTQRPCLLVDRLDQELDLQHRGIGDQFQGIRPGQFAHFMEGQHVVHCLGGREGEAEFLAAEVWRELSRFGPLIRSFLCLYRFLPVKIGKRFQLDESKEHYSIPVVCFYNYEEDWNIKPLDESEITGIQSLFNVLV